VIALVGSVLLFSNQEKFVGYVVRAVPELGDITFFVGFVLAGALYFAINGARISRGQPIGAQGK
jgi:cytosine/uracil/thiamine/allantoin permease